MAETCLIEEYIQYREKMCGDRPGTIVITRRVCHNWQTFVKDTQNHSIKTAKVEDLLGFVAHREASGIKASTIRNDLCIIRTFYEYLLRHRKVYRNPASSLPQMICAPPQERSHLTIEECLSLLSSIDTGNEAGLRNYVIIALLWSTGLRNRELCALKWLDIDLEDGALLVRDGKGGKQRQLFLNDRIHSDLKAYRKKTGGADDESVFSIKKPGKNTPMTSARLVEITRECGQRARITKPVNPMTFRHTFATHMFEAGVVVEDIKELMGHSELTETTIYIHVSLDAAKQILNDHLANPLKYV
jgi:site-specific recombinase XerD